MDLRKVDDSYSVTGQITSDDLSAIQSMGFKSIVCHRPDDEEPGQPSYQAIEAEARALGIEMRHIPIGKTGVGHEQVQAMVDALDELDRPMLGYCRSGARSTAVYQQSQHIRS